MDNDYKRTLYMIEDRIVSRDDYVDHCLVTLFQKLNEILSRLPPAPNAAASPSPQPPEDRS